MPAPDPSPSPGRSDQRSAGARRRWLRRLALGAVVLSTAGTLAAWTAVLFSFFAERPPPWTKNSAGPALSTSLAPPAPSSAPSPPRVRRNLDASALTLRMEDLPPGYHVLTEGPASFSPAGDQEPPAGWDVVFAPDPGGRADYLLVESLVAVYPDAATAAAAVAGQDAAERAADAVELPPIPGLSDRQAAWMEPAPHRPGYGIVRVTWRSLNFVGQVSVLGQVTPSAPGPVVKLATLQRDRMEASAPSPGPGPGDRRSPAGLALS